MYRADSSVTLCVTSRCGAPRSEFRAGLGLVNHRLLDVVNENVNIVSGEELQRANCTERIFVATGIHCKEFLIVRLLILVRNRSVITGNTSCS
jgi:hypothetical protein